MTAPDRADRFLADYPVDIITQPSDPDARVQGVARPKPETAAAATHTGAMLALIPSDPDIARLALPGGEPPEELHLTVSYLGDAIDIDDVTREKIMAFCADIAGRGAPIAGRAFAANAFNPHDPDIDTALVLGVGGDRLADLHRDVTAGLSNVYSPPANHLPWVPHVTLAYSDDLGRMPELAERLGPVVFDRLRVAFGDDVTDLPLSGDQPFDVEAWYAPRTGKLRLGQPGGFRRCVERLSREPGVRDVEGLCATLHKRVTGKWPGEGHVVTAAAADPNHWTAWVPQSEGDEMPSPEMLADVLAAEQMLAERVAGAHFHTRAHTEGVSTGRRVQMPGSLTWRTPPIPFNWETASAMHGGVPQVREVGLVTDIERFGPEIHAWGRLDLDDPVALEYARKLAEGWIRGVSIGLDEQPTGMELIFAPSDPERVIQEVYQAGNIYEITSSGGVAQETAYVEPLPALYEELAARGIEVAAAAFEETKHKRDGRGRFAKKAGGAAPAADAPDTPDAAAPAPAKKAAPKARKRRTPKAKAPDKAAAPSMGAFIRPAGGEETPEENEATKEAIAQAVNGTYGGVEVRVEQVRQFPGRTEIRSVLYDEDGDQIGFADRTLHRGNGDNPDDVWVSHDELQIERNRQGAGFAQEFNGHMEDWYRQNGVSHIRLDANIDVGGYAWARQGYDFANEENAKKIEDRASGILDSLEFELGFTKAGTPRHDDLSAQVAAGRDMVQKFKDTPYGSPGYPTPAEISQMGRQPGQGRNQSWFGKLVLMGSRWDGVKWL